ncbi:MAG: helicase-exonuclease AddAB subunit AddA, partial [Lachnospiraceae bacterium]|nr:helicase-exonuclease AddAB subunit AddA [Lachnospiraceae bacterium]
AEDGEEKLLLSETVDEVLNDAYESEDPEERAAMTVFVETFASGKNDKGLAGLIFQVYHTAVSTPYPEQWLTQQEEICRSGMEAGGDGSLWMQSYLSDAKEDVQQTLQYARKNLEIADAGLESVRKAAAGDLEFLTALLEADSYEEMRTLVVNEKKARKGRRKADEDADLETQFTRNRNEIDHLRKAFREETFLYDLGHLCEAQRRSEEPILQLIRLTEKFLVRFREKKTDRGILDFSDLEHCALSILRDENGRTEAAAELADQFRAVMVDEYQDSNYLQEEILTAVSRIEDGGSNYFQVGDVKQSIYSFRQARPELFMSKSANYRGAFDPLREDSEAAGRKETEDGIRIDLSANFRSRKEVLRSVNDVFVQIMRREVGGVDYDDRAALKGGNPNFPDAEGFRTEILAVTGEEKLSSDDGKDLEARVVANQIRTLVKHGQIYDLKTEQMRKIEYRDIVILLRTMDGWADRFVRMFESRRIPVYSTSKSGYFTAQEVVHVLDYLRILDNPLQDIPFTGVLKSVFGGLTAEELAEIRTCADARAYAGSGERAYIWMYEAARAAAVSEETGSVLKEKLETFFHLYDSLRARVSTEPIADLINELLRETGYLDYASALPGGAQRAVNLNMLIDKAASYAKTSYSGLFHFVQYIEQLQKIDADFGELSSVAESANVVRIMSIHKSKGLEYPIVFVSGMHKTFNKREQNGTLLVHPDLGAGSDYVDYVRRLKIKGLRKMAIRRKMNLESIGEELRVLYVAMTRAQQKLFLSGVIGTEEQLKELDLLLPLREKQLPVGYLKHADSFLKLVMPAALRTIRRAKLAGTESSVELKLVSERDLAGEEILRNIRQDRGAEEFLYVRPEVLYDERTESLLSERFGFAYGYAGRSEIPAKVSVTELKREAVPMEEEFPESASLYEKTEAEGEESLLVPSFMREEDPDEAPQAGTERGNAYHRALQYLPVTKFAGLTGKVLTAAVSAELEELIRTGRLRENEKRAIRIRDLTCFFESELGRRLTAAAGQNLLFREQPFMLSVPASELRDEWPEDEQILMQGTIDAWFTEGEEIILLDYKSDRVRDAQILLDRYHVQLESYREALTRITGKRVKETCIWSFSLGEAVRVIR